METAAYISIKLDNVLVPYSRCVGFDIRTGFDQMGRLEGDVERIDIREAAAICTCLDQCLVIPLLCVNQGLCLKNAQPSCPLLSI